jgi:hypothetical protein
MDTQRTRHDSLIARRPRLLATLLLALFLLTPRPAQAFIFYCWNPSCVIADQIQNIIEDVTQELQTIFYLGFVRPIPADCPGPNCPMTSAGGQAGWPPGSVIYQFQGWMIFTYFDQYVGAALINMGQQFLHDIFQQTLAVGAFMDAKNQLETQLLFQQLQAKAHKDYQPSLGMCVFGTTLRSIAAADFNANQANFFMARHQQNREMQHTGTKSAEGWAADRASRLQQFKGRFCQHWDNNPVAAMPTSGLALICNGGGPASNTKNNDIDYLRTVLLPRTLDIDFSDNTITGDEQDVLAMSSNLYSHDLFDNIRNELFSRESGALVYMGVRSVVAKRSVAETSFNAVVGMKVLGSGTSSPTGQAITAVYLGNLLDELGMPKPEIPLWLGDRPSYMATLEMLTKKVYQRPEFYTELYESPTNVKRRSVAMQAISVMMDRDIYLSYIRAEQIMAVLLETKLLPYQDQVTNEVNRLSNKAP